MTDRAGRSARRGVTAAGAIALAATLCACSPQPPGETSAPEVSPEPVPEIPAEEDFVSGGDCPPAGRPELPPDAGCVTSAEGDADGDGHADRFSLFARLDENARPVSWHVHLATSSRELQHRVDAGNALSYSRSLGVTDIDGDGRVEWWVKIYDLASHGTNWQRANIFVLNGDRLDPLALEDEPFHVNVGGISRMGEGARCGNGKIVLLRAEAKNVRNTRWRYSERSYSLHGAEVRFEQRIEGWLQLSHYNDPELDPYYRIGCDDLSYP